MTFQEHKKMYRSQHKTLGCKVTHMFGIPMIVTSLVMFFFNWPLALGLFVGGWALQFIGHFVFEKNRPVLFQDPGNPFTYFYAVIFVCEEWVRLFTRGTLKDDEDGLIKSIEKATGRNLREFFDQWVFGIGFPEYKITYTWDEKNKVATVKVSQTQKTDDGTPIFLMPIRLSFTSLTGKRKEFTVQVDEKEQSFSFALDFKPAMFRFDPQNCVLKKLDLSGVPKGMLVHQLANDPDVMGRVYAAHALAAMGGLDAVEALTKAVNSDFHWGTSIEAASALGSMGTPAAREALKESVTVADPRIRRSVVSALGNFKDESVAELLAGIVTGEQEQSYFVLADAAAALGKTGSDKAFAALQHALTIPSWNEVVRVGALNGLAELGDERGVDLAAEHAGGGQPLLARPAAISALGKLGKKAKKAVETLHGLADSEEADQFTLRMAVVGALGEAKNPDSAQVLTRLGKTAVDGRIKRAVQETMGKLNAKPADQSGELKAQVEGLQGKLKELTERLERQEAAGKPAHRTTRKRATAKKRR